MSARSLRRTARSRLSAQVSCVLALVLVAVQLLGAARTAAAEEEDSESKLAKETQNPVANLISVPFQNNFNFNTGTKDATVWILNVQPVIPIPIGDDWMLITRTIMPIINQPPLFPFGDTDAFGLGDINPTLFLSPANPGKFIWGVGPTMTFPTATVPRLGSGRWSAGPAVVGLYMDGRGWSARSPTSNGTSPAGATRT